MPRRRRPLPLLRLATAAAVGALLATNYRAALVLAILAVAFAVCQLGATVTAAARRHDRDRAVDELLRRDARAARLADPVSHVDVGFGIPATPRPRVVALPPRQGTAPTHPVSGWGR